MMLNEDIKKGLKNVHGPDECLRYLRRNLIKYTTFFNMSYTDYDETSFTEQVKAYKGSETDYVIVFTEFDNNTVDEVKVIFSKEEPRKPHPVFPLIKSITRSNDIYVFKRS